MVLILIYEYCLNLSTDEDTNHPRESHQKHICTNKRHCTKSLISNVYVSHFVYLDKHLVLFMYACLY